MVAGELVTVYREATEAQAFHEDRAVEYAAKRALAVRRMESGFRMSREDIARTLGLAVEDLDELLADEPCGSPA